MHILKRFESSAVPRWSALGGLLGLHAELDRLFDRVNGEQADGSSALRVWNPAVDVYEDKDNVFVRAEVPGLKKEDIDVSLLDGALSFSGERKSEEKSGDAKSFRTERFVGRFQRTVLLPTEVQPDKVTAQYVDGILTVTLPKAEAAKPKQIQISAN